MYHSNVQMGVSSNGLAPAPLGEHRLTSSDLTLEVAPDALDHLKAQPRWYKVASLRVVKISLLGKIHASASAGVSIVDVLGALFQNHGVDAVAWSIAETIREEISDYFPPDYTIFVRVDIRPSTARNSRHPLDCDPASQMDICPHCAEKLAADGTDDRTQNRISL